MYFERFERVPHLLKSKIGLQNLVSSENILSHFNVWLLSCPLPSCDTILILTNFRCYGSLISLFWIKNATKINHKTFCRNFSKIKPFFPYTYYTDLLYSLQNIQRKWISSRFIDAFSSGCSLITQINYFPLKLYISLRLVSVSMHKARLIIVFFKQRWREQH